MELAIINGTYRDSSTKAAAAGEFFFSHATAYSRTNSINDYVVACEEEWRRLAASAAAETRLLSPGMQHSIPNQIRAQQGTPLGELTFFKLTF
jgi:protein quaking